MSRLVLPYTNLRRLLSYSDHWQAWTGTANPTEALGRIHLIDLPAPVSGDEYTAAELAAMRPFAKIEEFVPPGLFYTDSWVAQRRSGGSSQTFIDSGRLTLEIEANIRVEVSTPEFDADAKIEFLTDLGNVLDEMLERAGTDDFLSIRSMRMFAPVVRAAGEEITARGDYFKAVVLVEHGI